MGTALSGCGKTAGQAPSASGGPGRRLAPVSAQGAVSVVTRNTTRLGGAEPAADAAAVARAVYPGLTSESRPGMVVVVDQRNWTAALAASALAGGPTGAPLLLSNGNSLPAVTRESLTALHPRGLAALGGAQVLEIGTDAPLPAGLDVRHLTAQGKAPAAAAAIEHVLVDADGRVAPKRVIVVPAEAAQSLQMPAAGLAAESGAPILLAAAAKVPPATADVLGALHHPDIYVLDPTQVGAYALSKLGRFGHVTQIGPSAAEGSGPTANAIAIARFTDGTFGWGVKEPGHGLVFANATRPLDGPAAALLSASADFGPLLLLEAAQTIPPALGSYLGDIQPAYTSAPQFQPVRGVYNHGWLIGDERAISSVVQAEIDSLLEISPRKQSTAEEAASQTTE
jgi:hypothetical protein